MSKLWSIALAVALAGPPPSPVTAPPWRQFESAALRLEHPSKLTLEAGPNGRVVARHSLPLRHVDPCVLSDADPWKNELVDFHVTLEVVEGSLPQVMARDGGMVAECFIGPAGVVLSPGFIDPARAGPWHGYRVWVSVEGCGELRYYLRLASRRSLRVIRRDVAAIQRQFHATPGTIPRAEADALFERLVGSVRLLPAPAQR